MLKITSTKNEYIRSLRKLRQKKEREVTGLFIAEGMLCSSEAVRHASVRSLLFTEKYLESSTVREAEEKGIATYLVTGEVMDQICSSKNPQGMAAVAERQEGEYAFDRLILFAEDISDPQNLGTLIRTADAMGACAVILTEGSADAFSPICVRASMGSIFHIPVVYMERKYFCSEIVKVKGLGAAAVAGHLKGKPVFPDAGKAAVLVGNETRGLSDEVSGLADVLYRIPMYGKAESLNVAVAAGIILEKAAEAVNRI